MTVRHVLLACPEWQDIRRDYALIRKDIKWALTTREGTSKAIRFVLQTGLLEQFRLHACESHETQRQPTREREDWESTETEGEEDVGRERRGGGF
jgi:hypothetical protein